MTFLIQRLRVKRGPHFNSSVQTEWVNIGTFKAATSREAMSKAREAVGQSDCRGLRIGGSYKESGG